MRILPGLLAAGLVAGLTTAAAAQTNGLYAGAEAGFNIVPEYKNKDAGGTVKTSTDVGYGLLGQVGYGFGPIRLEGELGWRQNDMDRLKGPGGTADLRGNLGVLSLMANAYYDFNTGTKLTPYVGVGAGGAWVNADKIKSKATDAVLLDDSTTSFAYQGIAGVSYAINNQLSLKADYRYFATPQVEIKEPAAIGGGKDKFTYTSHAIMVGFTYKFGAPPAPVAAAAPAPVPPPAPAPAPVQAAPIAKNFLVFFDFDKANITPEAQKIIEQAANTAKTSNSTAIHLTGHTDTVGTAKYNQALSLRRADAVKASLVKLGVPANEISVVGKGKTDLLVPTKDGVREPQNRRVQIVID
jgi:OmpA-OmpF porin, OOP family